MKVQEDELIIHELRPESAILGVWFFTKCLLAAFVGGFLCFWCFGFFGGILGAARRTDSSFPLAIGAIMALVVALVVLVLALVYCAFLRKTYLYYITNQRCIFHGGILRRIERSVHYHKITDVEMSQNILERILGISSLKIFTPGTSGVKMSPFGGERAEITFVGLKDNETPAATINGILRRFKATGE
jgi:uncharacterized membrane protein YdbT with pleckstrin-like domain